MIAPAVAAGQFAEALLVGAVLGLVYGLLQPLPRCLRWLWDGVFVAAAFAGWIALAFGRCGGYCPVYLPVGMLLGCLVWLRTAGRLLSPLFRLIWRTIFWPVEKILDPFQKIYKFLLARFKKWVTMKLRPERKKKGAAHDTEREKDKAGAPQEQPRHQSRRAVRYRAVGGGASGAVRHHRPTPQ